jgi:hypothetical protein
MYLAGDGYRACQSVNRVLCHQSGFESLVMEAE